MKYHFVYPLLTEGFNVISTGERGEKVESSSSDTCKGIMGKAGPSMAGTIFSCVFVTKVVPAVQ